MKLLPPFLKIVLKAPPVCRFRPAVLPPRTRAPMTGPTSSGVTKGPRSAVSGANRASTGASAPTEVARRGRHRRRPRVNSAPAASWARRTTGHTTSVAPSQDYCRQFGRTHAPLFACREEPRPECQTKPIDNGAPSRARLTVFIG